MNMGEVVALWYVDERTAADIVRSACELLVADVGGLAVAELAAVPYRHADEEVPQLLAAAMADLGIACHERGTPAADLAGLRAMAALVAAGELHPEEFAHWAHVKFGHDGIDEAQSLVWLSDEYEMRVDLPTSDEDLDAGVHAEVRRLLG